MSKKSFTIVELLVVMAVIGILITLAVVGIQAIQKSQRELNRQNDLRNISTEMARFYGKYRRYPIHGDDDINAEVRECEKYFIITNPGHTEDYNGTCDPNSDAPTPQTDFARIPMGQLSIGSGWPNWLGAGGFTTDSWKDFDCTGRNATADNWYVYYGGGSVNANAQTYVLGSCTENGKSINYGTRDDSAPNIL
jgi:prepilin-type N-terminal cleavage/methylation domain-containing protein